MARARNLKPGFFKNDKLAECDPLARLLFAGLWCEADREGRLEDRPKRIKASVLPYDDCDANKLLEQLHVAQFILRYESGGTRYIQILNFSKHQDPHYKEVASAIPAPPNHQDNRTTPGGVPEVVRQRIFDRDGHKCLTCGATDDLSLDHKIPRSKGGSHDDDNLQTLCRRCNSAKNNRLASIDRQSIIGQSSADQPGDSPPLIPDSLSSDSPIPISAALGAPKQKALRATRLPEDWRLPEEWREWARCERPTWTDDVITKVSLSFRDHWLGKGVTRADWLATWRNWVRSPLSNNVVTRPSSNAAQDKRSAVAAEIFKGRGDERSIDGEARRVD